MIQRPLTEESLEWACNRLNDFSEVHQGTEWNEKLEALTVLRASLGISDQMMTDFAKWAASFVGVEEYAVPMLLGLMIGLIAADREYEVGSD